MKVADEAGSGWIQWTGDNASDVHAWLVARAFGAAPPDWVEAAPDGTLAIMGDDEIVFVEVGQFVTYEDGRVGCR